jgi:ComF family protein
MSWIAHLTEGLRPVVDLVYPPRCPSCGEAVAAQGGLCIDCWSLIEVPGSDRAAQEPGNARILAATIYNDVSRKLVLAFKHGGKIALAPLLGRLMAARIPESEGELPLLVPVPLHRWRLWGRGYNQSALLAREIAKAGKGTLLVDALVRRKRTPSLGGLGREERRRALAGAIALHRGAAEKVRGRHVILVDDVLTSGATSNACVKVLIDAGAASVRVACFALASDAGLYETPGAKLQNETPEAITAPGAT